MITVAKSVPSVNFVDYDHIDLPQSELTAKVSESYGLQLRSTHSGTVGQLLCVLELPDAVAVAKAVLSYAETSGLEDEAASSFLG